MRSRYIQFLFIVLLLIVHTGCSRDREEGKVLVRINDYTLTLEEFQKQLAAEMEMDREIRLTREAKRELLERLITKELLIQEAKRLKLDTKEKFIRAIERYWESTLIRDLMEVKGKEIDQGVVISQDEIGPDGSGESREKRIQELREKKKGRMLKEWVDGLRNKARVEIDEGIL